MYRFTWEKSRASLACMDSEFFVLSDFNASRMQGPYLQTSLPMSWDSNNIEHWGHKHGRVIFFIMTFLFILSCRCPLFFITNPSLLVDTTGCSLRSFKSRISCTFLAYIVTEATVWLLLNLPSLLICFQPFFSSTSISVRLSQLSHNHRPHEKLYSLKATCSLWLIIYLLSHCHSKVSLMCALCTFSSFKRSVWKYIWKCKVTESLQRNSVLFCSC